MLQFARALLLMVVKMMMMMMPVRSVQLAFDLRVLVLPVLMMFVRRETNVAEQCWCCMTSKTDVNKCSKPRLIKAGKLFWAGVSQFIFTYVRTYART